MACGGGRTPGPAAELFDLRVSQGLWEGSCSPGWGLPEKEEGGPGEAGRVRAVGVGVGATGRRGGNTKARRVWSREQSLREEGQLWELGPEAAFEGEVSPIISGRFFGEGSFTLFLTPLCRDS